MACKDKYYNYGSYLRTRGYEKSFCDFITSLESGNVPIGPIIPNGTDCNGNPATRFKNNARFDKDVEFHNTIVQYDVDNHASNTIGGYTRFKRDVHVDGKLLIGGSTIKTVSGEHVGTLYVSSGNYTKAGIFAKKYISPIPASSSPATYFDNNPILNIYTNYLDVSL